MLMILNINWNVCYVCLPWLYSHGRRNPPTCWNILYYFAILLGIIICESYFYIISLTLTPKRYLLNRCRLKKNNNVSTREGFCKAVWHILYPFSLRVKSCTIYSTYPSHGSFLFFTVADWKSRGASHGSGEGGLARREERSACEAGGVCGDCACKEQPWGKMAGPKHERGM